MRPHPQAKRKHFKGLACTTCCRYALENIEVKSEEVKAQIQVLYKSFGKYHGISSLINRECGSVRIACVTTYTCNIPA